MVARKVEQVMRAAEHRQDPVELSMVMSEELKARRDRYGFSYLVVADDGMEAFAPVVDLLAGT